MRGSYYSETLKEFLVTDEGIIHAEIIRNSEFDATEEQKDAWLEEIRILKKEVAVLDSGHILFEYKIPRMGKRVDAVLVYAGMIFAMEFKVFEEKYPRHAIDQCMDYALDLKNFHEQSHDLPIVPVLVSTNAEKVINRYSKYEDGVFEIIRANEKNLGRIISEVGEKYGAGSIDAIAWENSAYKPTPTIIEAAQALYRGHNVEDISRSDASIVNLATTSKQIGKVIRAAREEGHKSICFITGVPGSGKTLAGLNIANERKNFGWDEHAVFLSGNGPLVKVLQEALARDAVKYAGKKKGNAKRAAKKFIQNIHHFRDDAIKKEGEEEKPPHEKVVIFDEAQRAWDKKMASDFMKRKKNVPGFDMSEPEFLISVMDRHKDWAVIICLVGGGQEINRGEAGILEWFESIKRRFPDWHVHVSGEITDIEYTQGKDIKDIFSGMKVRQLENLHLRSSIRSFRSESVSEFVRLLLDCKTEKARDLLRERILGKRGDKKYQIVLTRDLYKAKEWLRSQARGTERYGITASAKAHRLRPYGIYAGFEMNAPRWFLNEKDDLRSAFYLEYVASEFDIQGLELDWTCVAWDGNFRYKNNEWSYNEFRGTKWTKIHNDNRRMYLKNAYRVLLTRARQGMVIFVPKGDEKDDTRKKEYYENTYRYLQNVGISEI